MMRNEISATILPEMDRANYLITAWCLALKTAETDDCRRTILVNQTRSRGFSVGWP
ncbi:hypothetical protein HALLA_01175 (plasmid) [Halostagnicola larsenii XH-48]|uniref:Uncharacterized protein n=1 Tax=Halostagnicola larsenii XH-48 TaxID=797299 RepID=W0JY57_9EURY|nr:hypothetical protein HALLA_01175 [Halostagnicola larsenii XH-48]